MNAGKLTLGGGNNTLNYNSLFTVNGGLVELAGNSQTVGGLTSGNNITNGANYDTGSGGLIQSTTGGQATFASYNTATNNFGGQINGNIYFSKAGGGQLEFTNTSSYSGGTWLTGGITVLIDQAALTGTTSVELDYANLTLANTGMANLTNRLPDGAAITMKGGTFIFNGRPQTAATETVGVVTLKEGFNTISSNAGGTGINSADLTLNGFGVVAGTVTGATGVTGSSTVVNLGGATVNFTGTNLGTSGSNARIDILSGGSQQTPAALAAAGYMVNNIIPWATVGGSEFASYITYASANASTIGGVSSVSAGGIGALNATGYAGYDNINLPSTSAGTQNVRITTTQTSPSGTLTINSLNMQGVVDLNFNSNTDILNLTSGGLLRNGAGADLIGGLTQNNGNLTAGGTQSSGIADLYLYNNQNALTVDSAIINNPNGAVVRLVITGGSSTATTTLGFTTPAVGSVYSGGLIVNGGTVNVSGQLPGGSITLNATTFSGSASANFSSSPFFTMNNSVLNLFRSETLTGLAFNSSGSSGNVLNLNASSGMLLELPADGSGITSTPTSVALTDVATINAGNVGNFLGLNGLAQTFTVKPTLVNGVNMTPLQSGLTINAIITDGLHPAPSS